MSQKSSQINIKKSIIPAHVKTLAAIDSGITLLKCIYVRKDEPIVIIQGEEHYQFVLKWWKNCEIEQAANDILENALLPKEGILPLTGTSGDRNRELLDKMFSLRCQYQDELRVYCRFLHFCVKNMAESEYLSEFTKEDSQDNVKPPDFSVELMKDIMRKFHIKEEFPKILVIMGSSLLVSKVNEDGSSETLSASFNCGSTFLGLSKLLLGTRDFDEIIEMAEKGDQCKVDLTFQDISNLSDESPYGNISADKPLPIIPLGKAFQKNMSLSDFQKEDLAASLVAYTAGLAVAVATAAAKSIGTRNVYFGGGVLNSIFVREIDRCNGLEGYGNKILNLHYLKNPGNTALGAMIMADPEFEGYLNP